MKVDEKPEKIDEKTMDESMNLIGKDDEVGFCSSQMINRSFEKCEFIMGLGGLVAYLLIPFMIPKR